MKSCYFYEDQITLSIYYIIHRIASQYITLHYIPQNCIASHRIALYIIFFITLQLTCVEILISIRCLEVIISIDLQQVSIENNVTKLNNCEHSYNYLSQGHYSNIVFLAHAPVCSLCEMNRLTNRRRSDGTVLDGRHGIYGLCDGSSWHCITK